MFKFAPDTRVPERFDDLAGHKHRRLLGHIGFWFPLILIAIVLWRDGWDAFLRLDSVSAYYYSGAVSAFAGMLVAFAFFLFTYDGYRDPATGKPYKADRRCAIVAAIAALGVALFPTSAPAGFTELEWVKPWVVKIHFGSAAALFLAFAFFCLWLFPKKAADDTEKERKRKQARNAVYCICGAVILVCIAWAFYYRQNDWSIFWPESVALVFFSISWLVKGYAHTPVIAGCGKVYRWFAGLFTLSGDTAGKG